MAENDPNIAFVTKEKAQLVALKKYLFNIREQANALKNWKPKPRCGWLVQQLSKTLHLSQAHGKTGFYTYRDSKFGL